MMKYVAVLLDYIIQVFVKAGIFHGDEQLCDSLQTAQVPCGNPRWNEALLFSITVKDIPRSARLCVSLCSVTTSRSKKKQVS